MEASDDTGETVSNTCELVEEGGHMVVQPEGDETGVGEAIEPLFDRALGWVDQWEKSKSSARFQGFCSKSCVTSLVTQSIHCCVTDSCWSDKDTAKSQQRSSQGR